MSQFTRAAIWPKTEAQFEARRTFDNGFSIGGFFTVQMFRRNYLVRKFDKGLYFKIPFNGLLPGNSKSAYAFIMRPLERDGGRRLEDFSGLGLRDVMLL